MSKTRAALLSSGVTADMSGHGSDTAMPAVALALPSTKVCDSGVSACHFLSLAPPLIRWKYRALSSLRTNKGHVGAVLSLPCPVAIEE